MFMVVCVHAQLHTRTCTQGTEAEAGPTNRLGVAAEVSHFSYECGDANDKLLVVMALLKLGLVRKKVGLVWDLLLMRWCCVWVLRE